MGIILVFGPTTDTKFQGDLLSRALNTQGWQKMFNIALTLDMV